MDRILLCTCSADETVQDLSRQLPMAFTFIFTAR